MSSQHTNHRQEQDSGEGSSDSHSPFKSARREAKKRTVRRDLRRPGQPRRERRLSVRSELRQRPDVQKIARAVIALALAQAEAEAEQAKKEEQRGDHA